MCVLTCNAFLDKGQLLSVTFLTILICQIAILFCSAILHFNIFSTSSEKHFEAFPWELLLSWGFTAGPWIITAVWQLCLFQSQTNLILTWACGSASWLGLGPASSLGTCWVIFAQYLPRFLSLGAVLPQTYLALAGEVTAVCLQCSALLAEQLVLATPWEHITTWRVTWPEGVQRLQLWVCRIL